ncbi:MAG: MFS transporter [Coriobacteriaceae bacterium]|nr:MFS transporter [Coriobacteriaceae bacterium]
MSQPRSEAVPASSNAWRRPLAFVWIGEFISVLTSSILQMGLIWHVTLTTNSAGALSFVSLAAFLPMALLGAFAGTIVDRMSIKRLLIGADLFIAVVSFTLVFGSLNGDLSVAAVAVVAFARALGSTLHQPAFNALTPMIAPPEVLGKLAGILQFMQSGSFIIGNAIAAVIYPAFGLTAMIALDVAGAVLASVAVALSGVKTPVPERHTPEENVETSRLAVRTFLSDTAEGYRELKRHDALFAMLWSGFVFSVLFSPISALFPLMTLDHFGGTTVDSALAEIVFSVGIIVASGWIGATGGLKNRGFSCVLAIVLFGAATLLSGLVPVAALPLFFLLAFVMGFSSPLYGAPMMALMQERIEPSCMGRVFGLYGAVNGWAMPLGLIISALFADVIGVGSCFTLVGAAMVVLAGITWAIPSIRKIG